jgi:hypothetical protein
MTDTVAKTLVPRGGFSLPPSPAWDSFEHALASAIANLDHHESMLVEHPRAVGYVQVLRWRDELVAETTGNAYRAPNAQLTPEAMATLASMGWVPPDRKTLNHRIAAPATDATLLASILVVTMRVVLGIAVPDGFHVTDHTKFGTVHVVLRLGPDLEVDALHVPDASDDDGRRGAAVR